MKNMKKLGFTLIEIIGVIIVLGIIALVAFPTLLNLVKETNEKIYDANKALVFTAASQYVEENNDDFKKIEGSVYCVTLKDLMIDGVLSNSVVKKPLTKESKVRVELIAEKYQYFLDDECNPLINEDLPPTIEIKAVGDPFNENGWAKTDFYVNIEVIDDESGGHSYQWCSGINDCEPIALRENNSGKVLVSTDSDNLVVCAIGYDKAGNISDKTCSESYKLDKTSPIFNGINDLIVDKDDIVDLTLGVVVDDSLSGIEGAYSYNPMEVDTSKVIVTSIIYKAVDKAGNETAITRKIIVDTEAPAVNYTALGNKINSNGWSKEDFFVEASLIDYSGLGIKSAKWCSTTSDTCTPVANMVGNTMTPLISTESNNNRICVQATDNNNKTSEVICSAAYKLDKTKPIITLNGDNPYIIVVGNEYAEEDAMASDNMEGDISARVTKTGAVNNNVAATYSVTYNVSDIAGNQANPVTRTVNVIVENVNFEYTGNENTFVVPASGNYIIIATGGSGATTVPNSLAPVGKGALVEGTFALNKGEIIKIIVGEKGGIPSAFYGGGGGGGGTFLYNVTTNKLLLVAGGGGGQAAGATYGGGGIYGSPGTGNGGTASIYRGPMGGAGGGGGGGYLDSGATANSGGIGGKGYSQGLAGGTGPGGKGGFGGGGAGGPTVNWSNDYGGGGGGGGYTGGNGGSCTRSGSGGTSYIDSSVINPIGLSGSNDGNGSVSITYVGALSRTFSHRELVYEFIVPVTGKYKLTATGASGATVVTPSNAPVGKGALVEGTFALNKGEIIKIIVGEKGVIPGSFPTGAGGGGGTFLYNVTTNKLLLVAGGGGGQASGGTYGGDGTYGSPGTGNGGTASIYRGPMGGAGGGGGGGYLNSGATANSGGIGGKGYSQGLAGGTGPGAKGGFGGGGAGGPGVNWSNDYGGGGGGGGYTGGNGGACTVSGSGGTSYIDSSAINPAGSSGSNVGNGLATINFVGK